jgi:hypothetical protein
MISTDKTTIWISKDRHVGTYQKTLFIYNYKGRIRIFNFSESKELKSNYQKGRICVLSSYGEEL